MAWTSSAAILSNYDEVLKTFYLPAIQEQLNHDTILSDLIDVNEKDISGKDATIECHYGRTKAIGARPDVGVLPTADRQKFKTCKVPMKYNYARVAFTGPTIAATRDEKGSYARVVNTEIEGVVRDLQKDINRQLWGCGYSVCGRWLATSSGTTVYDMQKLYTGNAVGGDGFGSTFGGKYFEENGGGTAVVMTTAGGNTFTVVTANVSSISIAVSAVDASATSHDSVTMTNPNITEATGTYYARYGAVPSSWTSATTSGAMRYEMMGLRGIVTDTDLDQIALFSTSSNVGFTANDPLQGLATSTYSFWKSHVMTHASGRYAGQRALTLDMMQQMFDKVERSAGKDIGPNLIITTQAIRRKYLDLMQTDRRNVNTMSLDGGWEALSYNGVPLVVDPHDAIDGEIYFLTTADLQMYRMSDYEWMQKDGSVLSRISNYDAYEAVLFRYSELGTTARNTHGVICDLAYNPDR